MPAEEHSSMNRTIVERTQQAHKTHRCEKCEGDILPGQLYERRALVPSEIYYGVGASGVHEVVSKERLPVVKVHARQEDCRATC